MEIREEWERYLVEKELEEEDIPEIIEKIIKAYESVNKENEKINKY
ncbi:hypothetical protein [Anaerotalea alkaliphila]|uniref:Uncharacterized protein n=1 Tax=Anaerotalea alkaliphila TaxID=2662126 RepID=A0A7X5KN42_9FIRM|nr:hypothetical protein [Anaerotalea alkaliphila]NDL68479.1 hypothetical protein [Anaerotalea alkaliphila]